MPVEVLVGIVAVAVSALAGFLGTKLSASAIKREQRRQGTIQYMHYSAPPPVRSSDSRMNPPPALLHPSHAPITGNFTITGNPEPFAGLAGVLSPNELRANPELLVAQNLLAVRAELEYGTPITRPAPAPTSDHPPEVQAVLDEASMEAAVRRWDAEYAELCEKHWPAPKPEPEPHDERLTLWSGEAIQLSRPTTRPIGCVCVWTRIRRLDNGVRVSPRRISDPRCPATHVED